MWGTEKDIEKAMIAGMREGSKQFHADQKQQNVPTDHPNYEKDESTGAVINKNTGGFEQMKAQRERGKEFLQLKNDIETLKTEVAWLKNEINRE